MEQGKLSNSFVGGSFESDFKLLLIDAHYSIITGKWKRCETCFKEYLGKNHKCNAGEVKYKKEKTTLL